MPCSGVSAVEGILDACNVLATICASLPGRVDSMGWAVWNGQNELRLMA